MADKRLMPADEELARSIRRLAQIREQIRALKIEEEGEKNLILTRVSADFDGAITNTHKLLVGRKPERVLPGYWQDEQIIEAHFVDERVEPARIDVRVSELPQQQQIDEPGAGLRRGRRVSSDG